MLTLLIVSIRELFQVYDEIVKCNRLIRNLLPKKTVFETGASQQSVDIACITHAQFKTALKAKALGRHTLANRVPSA